MSDANSNSSAKTPAREANTARLRRLHRRLDDHVGKQLRLIVEMHTVPSAVADPLIGTNVLQMLAARLPCFACRQEDTDVAAIARFTIPGVEFAAGLAAVCSACMGRDLSDAFGRELDLDGLVLKRLPPGGRA